MARSLNATVRIALALVGVVLAPFAFRLALLSDRAMTGMALQDLRGFLSDLSVSLLFVALLVAASRVSRLLAAALAMFWVALHNANFENVRVLGSLATFHDAKFLLDPTFVMGSALAISAPWIFSGAMGFGGILVYVGLRGARLRTALVAIAVSLSGLFAYASWPWLDDLSVWRQTDFLHHNAARLVRIALEHDGDGRRFSDAPTAMLDLQPTLRADFSGEPIVPLDRQEMNVLLVILESVSGLRLPSVAAHHGHEAVAPMRQLEAVAVANLSFSTFINQQRKTARGLYAILCGEIPSLRFGYMKMIQYAAGDRTCLPAVLRNAGYETAYLQGAPLAFMLKDQFMPRSGFEQVFGDDSFERSYANGHWGIDDRAFFEQSMDVIEELDRGEPPWFVTLLTVGTHHPYVVPEDFKSSGEDEYERALAYLDLAFGEFHRSLEASGVLQNTLLVIVSDESRGFDIDHHPLGRLSQNWGFLVAQLPERAQATITDPFAQMDLAASILDFVGLGEEGRHFFGRSVFRHYETPRILFFANSNRGDVGALDAEGRVLLCLDDFRKCRKWLPPDGRAFAMGGVNLEWNEDEDGIVAEMARRSLHNRPVEARRRRYSLLAGPRVSIDHPAERILYGGQNLTVEVDEWIEVEVEVELHGSSGSVDFRHTLQTGGGSHDALSSEVELGVGETLHVKYTFMPGRRQHNIQCRAYARLRAGDGALLVFKTAHIVVHRSGDPPPPGVDVRANDIYPSIERSSS